MKKVILSFLFICLVLSGCSRKNISEKKVELAQLKTTINEEVEWPKMMEVDSESLQTLFYLNEDMYDEVVSEVSAMSVHAYELIMVKAKDGKINEVKESITHRIEDLEKTWSTYLPEQYELVKNAVKIEKGNYYFVIIHKDAKEIEKIINEAFES